MDKIQAKKIFYYFNFYKKEREQIEAHFDTRYTVLLDDALERINEINNYIKQTLPEDLYSLVYMKYIKRSSNEKVIKAKAISKTTFTSKTKKAFNLLKGLEEEKPVNSPRAQELIFLYQPIYTKKTRLKERIYEKSYEQIGLRSPSLYGPKTSISQAQRDMKKLELIEEIDKLKKKHAELESIAKTFEDYILEKTNVIYRPIVYSLLNTKNTLTRASDSIDLHRSGTSVHTKELLSSIEIDEKSYAKFKKAGEKFNQPCKK